MIISIPGRGKRKQSSDLTPRTRGRCAELPKARKTEGGQLKHLMRSYSDFFLKMQEKERSATLSGKECKC